jgi:hypothetical protein
MMTWLIPFLCSFGFRVRGGLFERQWRKLPLNKYWFAAIFAACACWLTGWSWNYYAVVFIAARLSTQLSGWGEGVGCALGTSTPDLNRVDMYDADEFCNNFEIQERDVTIWKWTIHIPHFKLLDHPQLWGVTYLTIRGTYLSFIIGLAIQSIPFMLCGSCMGLVYWLAGWLYRKGLDDGKGGWNIGEWIYGFILGLCLLLDKA